MGPASLKVHKLAGCRDVQHTGLYKVHKQEGTIAATTYTGKQGAQTKEQSVRSSQAFLHQWHGMHNMLGSMLGYNKLKKTARLLDMQCSH